MSRAAPISSRHTVDVSDGARALITALAYADLFDYPLSLSELTRFQAGSSLSMSRVTEQLGELVAGGRVLESGGFFCLPGREQIFSIRAERARASCRAWKRARLYAPILVRIPFVRMIAVTGALAVNNLGEKPDIDLMVLSERRRVWICRRFLIALVRAARLFGDDLCPNYILSISQLELDQRDFFTAHELAQMVPLCGKEHYRALLDANRWAAEYLPKAFEMDDVVSDVSFPLWPGKRRLTLLERVLNLPVFNRWERWEMERLRRKIQSESTSRGETSEVVCTPQQCKGHTGSHRRSILSRLSIRLEELELSGTYVSD